MSKRTKLGSELTLANKLRITRALFDWSQADLAAKVGLNQRAIIMLEQNATEPRKKTLAAIERLWKEEALKFSATSKGWKIEVGTSPRRPTK